MTDEDERFSQDAISRLTPVEPSAQLRRMVAQIPLEHPHRAFSWWPFGSLWAPGLSLVAAAFLGVFVGQSWEDLRERHAPVVADATEEGTWESDTTPSLADLADASIASQSLSGDPTASDPLGDDDLEAFLVLATTGDFEADDWALDKNPDAAPEEGPY